MGYVHDDAMAIAIGTLGYGLLDSRIILQLEIYLPVEFHNHSSYHYSLY